MRTRRLTAVLLLTLLAGPAPADATEGACPPKHQRFVDREHGWSVCVPSDWSRRERGSELIWSPGPGLDLVFAFQVKTVESGDVSAPLVAFLGKKKATLHVSPSGDLEYHLDGVDGVGLVTHEHRFGMLVYTWCDKPGEACEALVRKALDLHRTVSFQPAPDVPYHKWKALEIGDLALYASPGSPAAEDLPWLGEVYSKGYATLLDALGAKPSKAPLRIYFYPSEDENYGYTRRRTGFNIPGGPGEVHSLFASRGDRQSTGHEMAHAITNRSWGTSAQALLGEGIAVAMDLSGIDHRARAAKAIQTLEPTFTLSSLLDQRWWQHDMELSYGVSGSVVTFLLAEGSLAKVRALYQAPDLEAALRTEYGWTLKELETRWRKAIGLN
ncbi:MAG: hypothetical protein ABIK09_17950 [Pseudomonadota bacterium]